jgi:hypothetical protein
MVKVWFCRAKLGSVPLEVSPTETVGQVKSRLPGDKSSGTETLLFFKGTRLVDTSKISELALQDNDQLILLQTKANTVAQLTPGPIPIPPIVPAGLLLPPAPAAPLPVNMQQMISSITEAFASSVQPPTTLPNFFGSSPLVLSPATPPYIPPPARGPVQIPEEGLQMLMSMGFSEGRCRKALLLNRLDISAATDWLIEHIEDPEVDTPLTQQDLSRLGL